MKAPKYKLIPLGKIDPVAQKIAVLWVDGFEKTGGIMLNDKHKLASDIMNYAKDNSISFSNWCKVRYDWIYSTEYGEWGWGSDCLTTEQLYDMYMAEPTQIAQK